MSDKLKFGNNINAAKDEVATDAHWGAEMTYDYFNTEHSRNSFDNNGAKIVSYIHYGTNYNNAFWPDSWLSDTKSPFSDTSEPFLVCKIPIESCTGTPR